LKIKRKSSSAAITTPSCAALPRPILLPPATPSSEDVVSIDQVVAQRLDERRAALLLGHLERHGLDVDGLVGGAAGRQADGAQVVEAQAREEDVAQGPAEGREHAAAALLRDNGRLDQLARVAPALVLGMRRQQLQVALVLVAPEALEARPLDDADVGVKARVADRRLDLAG
jgi:hypothetical protein